MSSHLCPFALRTALPSSPVRRKSHDYYGPSVTLGLAPRRVDPTFVPVVRIERDVGVPLISLIALIGQRSTPRRLQQQHYHAVAERGAGIGCLSGGRAFASSGDWASGNPAFAISRGSRDTSALTPGQTAALLACDCSVHLSDPGKPSDPRTFLRVHPGCAGDTTERLAAHAEVRRRRGALAGPFPTPPSRTRRDRFQSPGSPVTMS